jgi:hypothetical protein
MKWSLYPGGYLLDRYGEAWQTLNTRCCNAHPLLDLKFIVPLFECFGSKDVLLAVRESENRALAMALIEPAGIGRWRLFMPSQANIGPILLDEGGASVADHLKSLIHSLPGVTWQVGFPSLDPSYCRLADIADEPRIERIVHWTTTYVDTLGSFEDFWEAKGKRFKQSVKRRFSELGKRGIAWHLKELVNDEDMAQGVAQYGQLESAGWKGVQGTAIREDNVQGDFYKQVLQNFSRSNGARIYQLYFDDRLVASQLTVSQNRMLVVLKTTYDESMAFLAPGRLLDYLVIERLFADDDINRIENYTNASIEDARWCSGTRILYHVNYYRTVAIMPIVQTKRRMATLLKRQGAPHRSGKHGAKKPLLRILFIATVSVA